MARDDDSPVICSSTPPPCRRLEGKKAIVTAATKGIGLAIACRLAQEGASVFICSRKQKNVDDAVRDMRSRGFDADGCACNVGSLDQLKAFVQKAADTFGGRIDILVSNAGVNPYVGLAVDAEERVFQKIFRINVLSYLQIVQLSKPYMPQGSSVVFVASTSAYQPQPPLGLYAVSKTAVVSLGKLLAVELGGDGIRVNCIAPGVVRTKMAEMLWKNEDNANMMKSQLMLGRLADPVDMSGVVAFMVSDDAKHMTGESIVVSGGTFSHL